MAESKLMRTSILIQIVSPLVISAIFLFSSVAEEKTNTNDIERNKTRIEKIEEKQDEQCDDIQINKEATIEIKGEIKNINDKLDSMKDMIKDIKTNLERKDNK